MKVKICGITREEDVKTCEANGAELIGFINIERSRRFVDVDKIRRLSSFLQDKSKAVLVTETPDLDEIQRSMETTGMGVVQFHSLSATEIGIFKDNNPQVKVIKAVGVPERMNDRKVDEIKDYAEICDSLLFDFEVEGKSGGTGKQIPLDLALKAAQIARKQTRKVELFLAGGMNSDRMRREGDILKDVFDYVDVNSGVEDQPGEKDEDKIFEFMNTVQDKNSMKSDTI